MHWPAREPAPWRCLAGTTACTALAHAPAAAGPAAVASSRRTWHSGKQWRSLQLQQAHGILTGPGSSASLAIRVRCCRATASSHDAIMPSCDYAITRATGPIAVGSEDSGGRPECSQPLEACVRSCQREHSGQWRHVEQRGALAMLFFALCLSRHDQRGASIRVCPA